MNATILELYNQIEKEKIWNAMDSIYWIYHIESIIVKEEGESKRYLKVLFFNRRMNEHNQLMRLYLHHHGEHIQIDAFTIVSQYGNENIMGFILERDLIDEAVDIRIEGYVYNGKKIDVKEAYIQGCSFVQDVMRLDALKTFGYLQKDAILAPYVDDKKWICSCGYYNQPKDEICPICANKKERMQQLFACDIQTLCIEKFPDILQITKDQPIAETIEDAIQTITQRFPVSKEQLLTSLNREELEQRQQVLVQDAIHTYIASHPFQSFGKRTYEEALDAYTSDICNAIITKDAVIKEMDIEKFQKDFLLDQEAIAAKERNTKKVLMSTCLFVFLFVAAIVGYKFLFQKDTVSYEGITIIYNQEARADVCKGAPDILIDDEEVIALSKEYPICSFIPEYEEPMTVAVFEDDDKRIKPLDEAHVLIEEHIELSENEHKYMYYIADLQGNKLIDKNEYVIDTYANGKISQKQTFVDGEHWDTFTYTYADNELKTVVAQWHQGLSDTIYGYVDGRIQTANYTCSKPEGDGFTQCTDVYVYSDNMLDSIQTVYDGSSLITNKEIYNNRLLNFLQPIITMDFENNEVYKHNYFSKYYYDKNGLQARIDFENDALGTYEIGERIYDFDKGKEIFVKYQKNENENWYPSYATESSILLIPPFGIAFEDMYYFNTIVE